MPYTVYPLNYCGCTSCCAQRRVGLDHLVVSDVLDAGHDDAPVYASREEAHRLASSLQRYHTNNHPYHAFPEAQENPMPFIPSPGPAQGVDPQASRPLPPPPPLPPLSAASAPRTNPYHPPSFRLTPLGDGSRPRGRDNPEVLRYIYPSPGCICRECRIVAGGGGGWRRVGNCSTWSEAEHTGPGFRTDEEAQDVARRWLREAQEGATMCVPRHPQVPQPPVPAPVPGVAAPDPERPPVSTPNPNHHSAHLEVERAGRIRTVQVRAEATFPQGELTWVGLSATLDGEPLPLSARELGAAEQRLALALRQGVSEAARLRMLYLARRLMNNDFSGETPRAVALARRQVAEELAGVVLLLDQCIRESTAGVPRSWVRNTHDGVPGAERLRDVLEDIVRTLRTLPGTHYEALARQADRALAVSRS